MSNSRISSQENHVFVPKTVTKTIVISVVLLFIVSVLSLAFGSRFVTWNELMTGLFYPEQDSYGASVVRERIPRTVFALFCGAALGVSGALMQAITRNPIADPSILGVNTGAALFVVSGLAFFNISTASEYIWFAIAGAMLTAIFVYAIGSLGRTGATPLKLVLAGAATSAALSSLVSAVLIPRTDVMDQFRFWQVGSLGSASWNAILTFLPFLIAGVILAICTAPALNALALGDDLAKSQGVQLTTLRIFSAFAGVVLCAVATALAGPIGFIGLLATHLVRLLLGPDLRIVIPMAAIAGAVVLTFADVVGRVIGSPGELEVGVVTALIGAPLLIYLAIKLKVRSL